MRSRPDLFSPQRIQAIFGNLEELYRFQKNLLVDLEHSLNWNSLDDSVVGGCFLQHVRQTSKHFGLEFLFLLQKYL